MEGEIVRKGPGQALERPARLGGQIARQTAKALDRIEAEGIVTSAIDNGRAALANQALENVAALSAFEAHLIEACPLGEARYKHIVDSYAIGASQAVARW